MKDELAPPLPGPRSNPACSPAAAARTHPPPIRHRRFGFGFGLSSFFSIIVVLFTLNFLVRWVLGSQAGASGSWVLAGAAPARGAAAPSSTA